MQLAIRCGNQKDNGESIVGSVSFNCDLSVQDPMGKDRSCSEAFLSASKAEWHSSEKCQVLPLCHIPISDLPDTHSDGPQPRTSSD